MSKKDKIPYFLCDWRAAFVAFPAIVVYVGFLPALKMLGIIHVSWFLALAPAWVPFVSFWLITGFVAFLVLITELGFLLIPDKNPDANDSPKV